MEDFIGTFQSEQVKSGTTLPPPAIVKVQPSPVIVVPVALTSLDNSSAGGVIAVMSWNVPGQWFGDEFA